MTRGRRLRWAAAGRRLRPRRHSERSDSPGQSREASLGDLAIIAGGLLVYSLVSGRLASTVLTGPLVFLVFGAVVSQEVLNIVDTHVDARLFDPLAKGTLVLVPFTDAALVNWPTLRRYSNTPLRLLGVGLPLMIIAGTLAVKLIVPGVEWWQAALVGVMLAPTDAALGQAVVTNEAVPPAVRQSLSVESGLNDGLAAPLLPVLLAGAAISGGEESSSFWAHVAKEISLGVLVGIAGGLAGALLIGRSQSMRLMTEKFAQISVAALSLFLFGMAEGVGGNAFVAAFIGGITFGNVARHVPGHYFEFSEELSQVLLLLTFFIFGGVFMTVAWDHLTWKVGLYAVLSLALIRPLTVAVAMIGSRYQAGTVAFLGWFGPRGLASIVFVLVVLQEDDVPGVDSMFLVVAWTVALSVVAHGLSAQPMSAFFGKRAHELAETPVEAPELSEVERFFRSTARLTAPAPSTEPPA